MNESMVTPFKRALGRGSAKDGTGHFWRQRLTALANVPLIFGFVILVVTLQGQSYDALRAAFGNPFIALFFLLSVMSVTVHMRLGMQVIIEDYVHSEKLKFLALVVNTCFAVAVALSASLAIVKLAFGG